MKEAYALLGARDPKELDQLYSVEDQKLMKSYFWDYADPDLITNKIKDILEAVDPTELTEDEQDWRQEILWFWYHHAISCAIWRYKDQKAARDYADRALAYQSDPHPNALTRLLSLLIDGRLKEAEDWVSGLPEGRLERKEALELIEEYKKQPYFDHIKT